MIKIYKSHNLNKCLNCVHLNFNHLDGKYEINIGYHFCGVHGRSRVHPGTYENYNFAKNGGCGFYPKREPVQLTFDFDGYAY